MGLVDCGECFKNYKNTERNRENNFILKENSFQTQSNEEL